MKRELEYFTLYYYGFDRNCIIESFDNMDDLTRRIDELKERGIRFKDCPVERRYFTVSPEYDILHEYRFEATDVFYSG